ncbi:GGDEF domain-containing protein [Nitriliruptoraceae bacterium ZYF776]|nr:GGDEF domain-containing protein [Profundirhabdus halotolerans]
MPAWPRRPRWSRCCTGSGPPDRRPRRRRSGRGPDGPSTPTGDGRPEPQWHRTGGTAPGGDRPVGRPTLTTNTRAWLERVAVDLQPRGPRVLFLGAGLLVSVGGHLVFDEPAFAWLAAPVALLAGMTGGLRTAIAVAAVAAVGHATIDVLVDPRPAEVVGVVLRAVVLVFLGIVGTAGAQLERQRDRALHQAVSEDPVTGLLNVRVFYDEVARLRAAGTPFSVLLADIRGMRRLNETYGHPTGTEAMRALSHVLRRCAGKDVIASRLGSDEVAVLLVGDERARCRSVVDDIIERLRHERIGLPDGGSFEVHAAYGIARWPEDGEDTIDLLRAAERAKERAKAAGLDGVGLAKSARSKTAGD